MGQGAHARRNCAAGMMLMPFQQHFARTDRFASRPTTTAGTALGNRGRIAKDINRIRLVQDGQRRATVNAGHTRGPRERFRESGLRGLVVDAVSHLFFFTSRTNVDYQ